MVSGEFYVDNKKLTSFFCVQIDGKWFLSKFGLNLIKNQVILKERTNMIILQNPSD